MRTDKCLMPNQHHCHLTLQQTAMALPTAHSQPSADSIHCSVLLSTLYRPSSFCPPLLPPLAPVHLSAGGQRCDSVYSSCHAIPSLSPWLILPFLRRAMSAFRPLCRRQLCALLVAVLLLIGCSDLLVSAASASPTSASSDVSKSRDLYCALCEAVMDEMEAAISRLQESHGHTVQTAWRIDEKRRIPYARTESVLLGLLEDDVPPLLRLYGVSNHTGRQRLLRRHDAPQLDKAPLIPDDEQHSDQQSSDDSASSAGSENGSASISNSSSSAKLPYSASEFSSTSTLTDTLSALYVRMLDSYLEDIMLAFHKQHADVKDALCIKTIRACKKGTTFEPFRRPRRQGQESGQTEGQQLNHVDL